MLGVVMTRQVMMIEPAPAPNSLQLAPPTEQPCRSPPPTM